MLNNVAAAVCTDVALESLAAEIVVAALLIASAGCLVSEGAASGGYCLIMTLVFSILGIHVHCSLKVVYRVIIPALSGCDYSLKEEPLRVSV